MEPGRSGVPWFVWVAAVGLIVSRADVATAGGSGGIWRFDFREVFYDGAFLNSEETVIVGARGSVLVTDDRYRNLWRRYESGTRELLTSVSFVDSRHGWAAGHGGVILRTADGGKSWEVQRESEPKNQPLLDIQFVSAQVGFACGAYNTFLKTTSGGEAWEEIPTGFDIILNGMAFLDPMTGYLVGEFGTVARTEDGGLSWEKLDLGDHQGSLFGITLLSADEIIVCGIAGTIFRSEDGGRTWREIPAGIDQSLFRAAASGDEVVLVGSAGTLLCSRDRGKSFVLHKDEDLTSFAGVRAHPAGGFLCVGERGKICHFKLPEMRAEGEAP